MTHLSPAELRQLCIDNPEFVSRNIEALKGLSGRPRSAVTMEGERVSLSKQVDASDTLMAYMRVHAPDIVGWFIREYHFEKYRIDLADPQHMVAIEVNGGRWLPGGGKHGKESDRRKIRRLTLAGWRVLEYSTELLANDPLGIIEEIRSALQS